MIKEETEKLLKDLYTSGCTGKQVAASLGISLSRCYYYIKKLGIGRSPSQTSRKYSLDEDFFYDINSDSKAYVLGLLFADGHIERGDRGSKIVIGLQERDKRLLEDVSIALQSNKPLYPIYKTCNGKTFKGWRIAFSSKKLVNALEKYGCVSPKWNRIRLPDLSSSLMHSFLRGYIDGDGCIYLGNSKRYVSLTGNRDFIEDISSFLKKTLNICGTVSPHHSSKDVAILRYNRWDDIAYLLDFIYTDSTIHLERKYQKYLQFRDLYLHSNFSREFPEETLANLYRAAGSWRAVGERLGLSDTTLRQHRHRLGYKVEYYDKGGNPRYPKKYLEKLKQEYKTWSNVSQFLGIKFSTLQYHLRKVGL
jgi:hypothetical protein